MLFCTLHLATFTLSLIHCVFFVSVDCKRCCKNRSSQFFQRWREHNLSKVTNNLVEALAIAHAAFLSNYSSTLFILVYSPQQPCEVHPCCSHFKDGKPGARKLLIYTRLLLNRCLLDQAKGLSSSLSCLPQWVTSWLWEPHKWQMKAYPSPTVAPLTWYPEAPNKKGAYSQHV